MQRASGVMAMVHDELHRLLFNIEVATFMLYNTKLN